MTKSKEALRHYTFSPHYEIFESEVDETARDDRLTLLYSEICAQWRNLHDTRFKLLGILPLATVATLILAEPGEGMSTAFAQIVVFALGLVVAIGLRRYDRRNDTLYDDLISRGRKVEYELGIYTGVFRGRIDPEPGSNISHGKAIGLVYNAIFVAWIAGLANALQTFVRLASDVYS